MGVISVVVEILCISSQLLRRSAREQSLVESGSAYSEILIASTESSVRQGHLGFNLSLGQWVLIWYNDIFRSPPIGAALSRSSSDSDKDRCSLQMW